MQAELIPVKTWAERVFGDEAPHRNTLRSWVTMGKISPQPIQVGRRYFVEPSARYIDPTAEKIRRLTNGR
ncbi:excisionase-like protein [Paraburkholderia eburnea]|uniref:Excisionase-like protein n=1 Tax=Paraburkholderia eburnea TaxID=1189126 RepID=A0A2S4MDH3_9BURK|nr:excisionase [Paraburkholderia eburnea]POR52813.1 excisionase-like protein [Paraburkholderia eburnea]PRZ23681.1 excisionase-like protein [Paraburkholderia eburnea]